MVQKYGPICYIAAGKFWKIETNPVSSTTLQKQITTDLSAQQIYMVEPNADSTESFYGKVLKG